MDALRIDANTQGELGAIFAAFKGEVIVAPGARVPADPGLCRKPPNGDSTYARAGGVYPLAAFADELVDRALDEDAKIKIIWEDVRTPGATRHPPGLKYLFTELLCSAAGGPEGVTSKSFDEAKLGVPAGQWEVRALVFGVSARLPSEWLVKSIVRLHPRRGLRRARLANLRRGLAGERADFGEHRGARARAEDRDLRRARGRR